MFIWKKLVQETSKMYWSFSTLGSNAKPNSNQRLESEMSSFIILPLFTEVLNMIHLEKFFEINEVINFIRMISFYGIQKDFGVGIFPTDRLL